MTSVSNSQISKSFRANRPKSVQWLGRFVLSSLGWKVTGKIKEEQNDIENGKKAFDVNLASKQIWSLNQAMSLVEKAQLTLDEIENGNMSPMSDIGFI